MDLKKILIILIALILFAVNANAQLACSDVWSNEYPGPGTAAILGESVIQTNPDLGYIMVGNTLNFGVNDMGIWIVKADSTGTTCPYGSNGVCDGSNQFARLYDNIGSDSVYEIQQTSDNGYIIIGGTDTDPTIGENFDAWLIKIDSSGNPQWDFTFGSFNHDVGWAVKQTPIDGGYIITGHNSSMGAGSSDVWLLKIDSNGVKVWEKTFGDTSIDVGHSVELTNDGGYIIAGNKKNPPDPLPDVYLIKTDSSGTLDWEFTYGGVQYEEGWSVKQTTPDNGYIIVGHTESFGAGDKDVYMVKTDSSGTELWNRTYGLTDDDRAKEVYQTPDGGYIISARIEKIGPGGIDSWLIKTDSAGLTCDFGTTGVCFESTEKFANKFGTDVSVTGQSVFITSDGGYVMLGADDYFLVKTDVFGHGPADCTACGDGIPDPFEQCDDGVSTDLPGPPDDGACVIHPNVYVCMDATCSDGYLYSVLEECDDGNLINEDACTNACLNNICGDGYLFAPGEECDNAGANSDTAPDACRSTLCPTGGQVCCNAWCGDGVIDSTEQCDDMNTNPTDGCDACVLTVTAGCGNGVREVGEACDDGDTDDLPNDSIDDGQCIIDNTTPGPQCVLNLCDGINAYLWDSSTGGAEQCDWGIGNSDTTPDACRTTCLFPICGDNIVDPGFGEQCDDGTPGDIPGDATLDGACIIDLGTYECQNAVCGDGYLKTGEECDDGNLWDGDGCLSICELAGSVTFNDILEVEFGDTSNQYGQDTVQFNANETLSVEVFVTNHLGYPVTGKTLTVILTDKDGTVLDTFNTTQTFNGGTTIVTASFLLAAHPNDIYRLKASIPVEGGEETFYINNDDEKYVTLSPDPEDPIEAPETNNYLVALTAGAVIALIYLSSKRNKLKKLYSKHTQKLFKKKKKNKTLRQP